jgi:hypothetical protein
MTHLIEVLIRYSKATNIPLPIEDGVIDLSVFFGDVYNKGCMNLESFEELKATLK